MNKKVAIMQPYFFPYLGYFQLVQAVDVFVFYDDVNYIKRGWINRNNIILNNKPFTFSVPIKNVSQNNLICQSKINVDEFEKWKNKFFKQLESGYKKATYYHQVLELIENVLNRYQLTFISELAIASVTEVLAYLHIDSEVKISSQEFTETRGLGKSERLIAITKQLGANQYVNPTGGTSLYSKSDFKDKGVDLFFIQNTLPPYGQFSDTFVPGMSIIDVLMHNDIEQVKKMLTSYSLI